MSLFGNKKGSDDTKVEDKKVKASATKTTAKKKETKEEKKETTMADLYEGTKSAKVSTSKKTEGKKNASNVEIGKVLVKPLVTEKAATLSTSDKYVFVVSKDTNKIEVAKAVESLYGVNVTKVNVTNITGKTVFRGRIKGKRNDFKKAIVTLKKGQTISIHEGV